MTIRALIFDYGGVLMRTVNPVHRRELERELGLLPGEVNELIFESPLWDEAQLGRVSSAEFWADVGAKLGLDVTEVERFRRAFWSGDRLDEELVAQIRHLRQAGYKTALLSNAPAGLQNHVERLGIADAFDSIVISGREGLMKPEAAIYQLALAQLQVTAEQAIFIDDTQENVTAARQVGLQAERFRGLAPLRKWLQSQDVDIPPRELEPLPDVQAVIFDWGGVMEALPDEAHVASWERRLALSPGALPQILWGKAWRRLETGAITDDDYAQYISQRLGLPNVETGFHFLQEFYTTTGFNREVMAAVRALRRRYTVALLSNAFPGQSAVIREQHGIEVEAEFDVYVNSALVGLSKPDPAVFHLTLERLRVEPPQAIFLDDRLENVDSAGEVGIHTVQFVDAETSLGQLEALLGHLIR